MSDTTIEPPDPHRPSRRSTSRTTKQRTIDIPAHDDALDDTEVIAAVCKLFFQGMSIPKIAPAINEMFPNLPVKMKRETPWHLMHKAAHRRWLKFQPPPHVRWTNKLQADHRELKSVRVVHTSAGWDVARYGAESLLGLVQYFRRSKGRREVHIGFSGGHAMRMLARAFADLLYEPADNLPDTLVIHAMAAGFDPRDPTMDPNTFFSYFKNGGLNEIKVEFRALAAPLLVTADGMSVVRDQPGIKEALAAVREIDIIAASGSDWLDPHSAFRNLMLRSPESKAALDAAGVIADIGWWPFGMKGPITTKTSIRALTLVELNDLPGLIRQGKRVLLTLGPCGLCHTPKGRLLDCLLKQSQTLVSDLVVDSRSVAQMMRLRTEAPGH